MELGMVLATRGVADEMERSPVFSAELANILIRYQLEEWGDLCQEDWELNNSAVISGDRVLGSYHTALGTVWIITEWDRSITTILFPSEY